MVFKERQFLEFAFFKHLVGHIVQGKGYFAVFVYAIIVVLMQVAALLSRYHLAHEFNGRVVLARVFGFLARHLCRAERAVQRLETEHQRVGHLLHRNGFGFVAEHRKTQTTSFERKRKTPVEVGLRATAVNVYHIDEWQFLTSFTVNHHARNVALGQCGTNAAEQQSQE